MADGNYIRTGGGGNQIGREARMRVQADARKAVAASKLPRKVAFAALHAAGIGCDKWLAVVGALPGKWLLISPRKSALVVVTVDAATLASAIDLPIGAHVMPSIAWPTWLGDDCAIGKRLPDGRLELRRGRGYLRLDQTRSGYLAFWHAAIPAEGTGEIVDPAMVAKWIDGATIKRADKATEAAKRDDRDRLQSAFAAAQSAYDQQRKIVAGPGGRNPQSVAELDRLGAIRDAAAAELPAPAGKFARKARNASSAWAGDAALVAQALAACGDKAELRRLPESNGRRAAVVAGNGQLWILHG